MTKQEIVEYIVDSYLPIQMAIPAIVVEKNVEEAIRWFNREGSDVVLKTFPYGGTNVLELPTDVGEVMEVYPSKVVSELYTAQSLMLGVTVLDFDIDTLVSKFSYLSSMRTFLSSKLNWKWVKPYLHLRGNIADVGDLTVQYLRDFDFQDCTLDIPSGPLDFILRYAQALTDIKEGKVRRLGSIIDAPLDGASMVSEGEAALAAVKENLIQTRRLVAVSRSK